MKTSNYIHKERKRNRLKEYDYSQGGYYFVTVCVDNRKDIFGNVKNGKCFLNNYGTIVKKNFENLKNRYSYIKLDYYVIMPNHIHAIIIIDPSSISVGTGRDLSQNKKQKIKSLSEIVGAFKTMSSKEIHLTGNKLFKWQRSFYDRIIRNEKELYYIRRYIEQNPLSLEIAKEFPDNLDL